MEVDQGEVARENGGADSVQPSSPSLEGNLEDNLENNLELLETWGQADLLTGAGTIMTDELPNNSHSHALGLETNDRELVVSLRLENERLRDKLRTSRIRERSSRVKLKAARTRERALRAKLRAQEEENREMQYVLLDMIARISGPEP